MKLEGDDGCLREDLPPIQRWLNRLRALRIALQNAIFDEFLGLVEARVADAREAGTLDLGVETVRFEGYAILDDRIIRTDPRSGATSHLLRLELARKLRPMPLERLIELRSARPGAMPMVNAQSGKAALSIEARSLMSEEGLPIARYELVRPLQRKYIRCDRLDETRWAAASDADFAQAWSTEARAAEATLRRETLHLATGLLLPIWDKLPGEHGQVIRIAAEDGRSLLGREIPPASLAELGVKLGLDVALDVPPDELAKTVLRAGKPLPFRGIEDLVLKRSLVNSSQCLELAGFSAARLQWYKAEGCFTEVIRYQTRLFVPVDRAASVLSRLLP